MDQLQGVYNALNDLDTQLNYRNTTTVERLEMVTDFLSNMSAYINDLYQSIEAYQELEDELEEAQKEIQRLEAEIGD